MTTYLVRHTDDTEHVWLAWATRPVCGSRDGLPGTVVSVLDSGDVTTTTTCADCVKALDDLERTGS